jgi:phage gpG-like protein
LPKSDLEVSLLMPVPAHVIGAFADKGGSVRTVLTWKPDPDEVARALVQVADYLEDLGPPLRASARIIQNDIEERFTTETAPNGDAWQELNDEYLEYKTSIGGDTRKLRLWGGLHKAATSFSRFTVDAHSGNLFYNATGLPYYWDYHQSGTRSAARAEQIAGIAAVQDETVARRVGGRGAGRGKNIPARPYIGVSAEAEEVIFNVFDLWAAEGTKLVVTGAGVLQRRGPGGRIGGKFNLT